MSNIRTEDQRQIEAWGLTVAQVEKQIQNFINGFPFLPIIRPAIPDDGIVVLKESEVKQYEEFYQNNSHSLEIVKFVPASGAASRMFKELFEFLDNNNEAPGKAVEQFLINLKEFAFYDVLKKYLVDHGKSLSDAFEVIDGLLNGLGYGHLPKGALLFHSYDGTARTPIEEHFVEGAKYASGKNNTVHLHFTVSPEFQNLFETLSSEAKSRYEAEYKITFDVSFSQQKKAKRNDERILPDSRLSNDNYLASK